MNNPYKIEGDKMGKSAIGSRLNWVGILTALVSVASYFQGSDIIASNPKMVSIFGTVVGVGTVILRLLTKEPITGVVKPKVENNG